MITKTNVYFTVDTESSMGGAWEHNGRSPLNAARHVFCRIGSDEYGIPLISRIMKEFSFHGTFFVETLSTICLGDADMQSVFDYLLEAGHDLQLHIHPTFRFYSEWLKARKNGIEFKVPIPTDQIGCLPEHLQMDLLAEAAQYFEKFAGYKPTVFRAGCYAGSRSMMRTLNAIGIKIDSSFNPCYHPALSFSDEHLIPNLVQKIEGVWEIPITVARTKLPEGSTGFKYADCTSLSFPEIRTMLDTASFSRQQHFVLVFHSFSAVKSKDETFEKIRPNRIVIRRLEKLFRYLAENSDRFCVETMGKISLNPDALQPKEDHPMVVGLGLCTSTLRKAVQMWNSFYWT